MVRLGREVEGAANASELATADVGIDLGRARACVAKELLDVAEIGAGLEQMRCEAVPEDMGCNGFLDACPMACPLDHVLDRPCGDGSIRPLAREEPWAARTTCGQDHLHGLEGSVRQERVPIFSSLTSPDEDQAPFSVEVFRPEAYDLAAPEPRGVEEEDERSVSDVLDDGDESFDLVAAEDRREACLPARPRDAMDRVGPVEYVTEEEIQRTDDLVVECARNVVLLESFEYIGPGGAEFDRSTQCWNVVQKASHVADVCLQSFVAVATHAEFASGRRNEPFSEDAGILVIRSCRDVDPLEYRRFDSERLILEQREETTDGIRSVGDAPALLLRVPGPSRDLFDPVDSVAGERCNDRQAPGLSAQDLDRPGRSHRTARLATGRAQHDDPKCEPIRRPPGPYRGDCPCRDGARTSFHSSVRRAAPPRHYGQGARPLRLTGRGGWPLHLGAVHARSTEGRSRRKVGGGMARTAVVPRRVP